MRASSSSDSSYSSSSIVTFGGADAGLMRVFFSYRNRYQYHKNENQKGFLATKKGFILLLQYPAARGRWSVGQVLSAVSTRPTLRSSLFVILAAVQSAQRRPRGVDVGGTRR